MTGSADGFETAAGQGESLPGDVAPQHTFAGDGKGPDAFRTIREVADELDLPQHVLRFWETRFTQIRPLKRGGSRRYYRPEDVGLLRGIRHLLYRDGYTIKGVQRILKAQGPRFVTQIGEGAVPAAAPLASDADDDSPAGLVAVASVSPTRAPPQAPAPPSGPSALTRRRNHVPETAATVAPAGDSSGTAEAALGATPAGMANIAADDRERLIATLAELLECKRLLDQAR